MERTQRPGTPHTPDSTGTLSTRKSEAGKPRMQTQDLRCWTRAMPTRHTLPILRTLLPRLGPSDKPDKHAARQNQIIPLYAHTATCTYVYSRSLKVTGSQPVSAAPAAIAHL